MSVRVMTWVWHNSPAEHGERLVLLAIADNASDDGTRAWPSVAEIRSKTRLSERAVQGAIRGLAAKGWLLVDEQTGPHGCNRYTVVMADLPEPPAESAPPQNLHPAESAPRRIVQDPPQNLHPPPQNLRPTPADSAPVTVLEPSKEPSKNHPGPRKRAAPTRANRGTRLPDDWQPTPRLVDWCRTECPGIDGRTETEKFRNHWHSKAGRDATKLDWGATWRNWMLNARDRYGPSGSPRASPNGRQQATDAMFDRQIERARARQEQAR